MTGLGSKTVALGGQVVMSGHSGREDGRAAVTMRCWLKLAAQWCVFYGQTELVAERG